MDSPTNYTINLIGDGGVGKTSWVNYIFNGVFQKKYIPTPGMETHQIPFFTNYGIIDIFFRDISGQEKFSKLRDDYYTGSDGAIIFCDVTSRISMKNLLNWITSFKRVNLNKPILIVGNKVDVKNSSSNINLLKQMEKSLDQTIFVCSVKNGLGAKLVAREILRQVTGKSNLTINQPITMSLPEEDIMDKISQDYIVNNIDGEDVCVPAYCKPNPNNTISIIMDD